MHRLGAVAKELNWSNIRMPTNSLLKALDDGKEKPILAALEGLTLSDITELSDDLDALFKVHAEVMTSVSVSTNWIQCLMLLGCQKKTALKKMLTRLRECYRCDGWMMGAMLLQLLERYEWPLEEALVEYSLPKTYPHSWGIAFQLVEAGRVEQPAADGWLNWMPDGFSRRTLEYGECGISTLQNEPSLLALVEDFFRSPAAGTIPSTYFASGRSIVGVGDKPPKHRELKTDNDWSHYSRYCIGVALYGLAVRGHYEMEKVRTLLFVALPSVTKTPAARWLTGLIDLACDDDDLERFGLEEFAEHDNKALAKWAAKKLAG